MSREQRLDRTIRRILANSGMPIKELYTHMFRRNWQVYANLIRAFFKTEGCT